MATYAITALGTEVEFDTAQLDDHQSVKLTSTRLFVAYKGLSGDGWVQTFDYDSGTGNLTANTRSNYDTSVEGNVDVVALSSTQVVVIWSKSTLTKLQVFNINSGTGAVSAPDSAVTMGTGTSGTVGYIDGTHVLAVYATGTNDGASRVYSVNTSTGVLTAEDSEHVYETTNTCGQMKVCMLSNEKALIVDPNNSTAVILSINNSTWAISNQSTLSLTYTPSEPGSPVVIDEDASNIEVIYDFSDETGNTRRVQALQVAKSDFSFTENGSAVDVGGNDFHVNGGGRKIDKIDASAFALTGTGSRTIETWSFDKSDGSMSNYDSLAITVNVGDPATATMIDSTTCVVTWKGTANDGFIRAYSIDTSAGGTPIKPTFQLLGVGSG